MTKTARKTEARPSPVSLRDVLDALVEGRFEQDVWRASDDWSTRRRLAAGLVRGDLLVVQARREGDRLFVEVVHMDEDMAELQGWGWSLGVKGVKRRMKI
jgi:hypothetical protein